MKYIQFLRGNEANFRTMYGLSQAFDACEYKGRHGWLWYNPSNQKEYFVAIECCDDIDGILIDVIKDDTIIPKIEIIQKEPAVCDIKNKTEVKKKIESIVKFIYNMDMNRKQKK